MMDLCENERDAMATRPYPTAGGHPDPKGHCWHDDAPFFGLGQEWERRLTPHQCCRCGLWADWTLVDTTPEPGHGPYAPARRTRAFVHLRPEQRGDPIPVCGPQRAAPLR